MDGKRFQNGDPLNSQKFLEDLRELEHQAFRPVIGGEGVAVTDGKEYLQIRYTGEGGDEQTSLDPDGFWGQIIQGSTNPYVLKEVMQGTVAGSWNYDGTVTVVAREVNSVNFWATGSVVWVNRHDAVDWYVFRMNRALPDGSGQYKVMQLNGSNIPHWDFVRAHE